MAYNGKKPAALGQFIAKRSQVHGIPVQLLVSEIRIFIKNFTEGRGADGNSFVRWLDVNADETYFIVIDRPEGNSPFNLVWTGTATFADPPSDESITSGTPLNFEKCDDLAPFDDGFVDFNLSDNTTSIVGSQINVTITYHVSASDANIGINPLTSPYRNISNPQIIFARITNIITGCFELTTFQLNVNLGPNFTVPSPIIMCDNLDDGNNRNGQTVFDLTSRNDEILNGQNQADFNILFYDSRTNADNSSLSKL